MKEYKSRVESYSREMLRKESQIKELQGRIEIGDGCKYIKITFICNISAFKLESGHFEFEKILHNFLCFSPLFWRRLRSDFIFLNWNIFLGSNNYILYYFPSLFLRGNYSSAFFNFPFLGSDLKLPSLPFWHQSRICQKIVGFCSLSCFLDSFQTAL